MRIEGPPSGPLRGNVYSNYGAGHWMGSRFEPESTVHSGRPLPDSSEPLSVIRYASTRSDRFFLPRGVSALQTEPARARVNAAEVRADAPEAVDGAIHGSEEVLVRGAVHDEYRRGLGL